MPSLWHTLRQRWLAPRDAPAGNLLTEHLRRDAGLCDPLPHVWSGPGDAPVSAAICIRDRNFSEVRTFCTLHP